VAVTNAPVVINAFGDLRFVFNTPYDFTERFNGEPDYFSRRGEQQGLLLDTNFVADAVNLPLYAAGERGAGGGHIRFSMAKGYLNSHISQFPVGTYKKAHAHGPGAHVIIMSGEGYSLMWPEGEEPRRFEWQEGSMIVPPNLWYHQHFNTGAGPARYLAFKAEGVAIRNAQGVPKSCYADESPRVRQWFVEALTRKGLESRMEKAYEAELADLGAGSAQHGRG
jgi:oxalate decarboxylase/phosphoglucose isomerase-like protein (cupin superfamily)